MLPREFFARDTLTVARELLGMRLVFFSDHQRLTGIVSETEAYIGETDLACHAKAGLTPRTAVMFGPPGYAYVYLTYGMHWMLNAVTETAGFPAAVLIRAVLPEHGQDLMRTRRQRPDAQLTNGPAKLTQAFGIDKRFHGADLCDPVAQLYFEMGNGLADWQIVTKPRVGLGKTPEPWLSKPWNFKLHPA